MHGITFLNRWALAIAPLAGFALLASPAHAGIAVEKIVTCIDVGGVSDGPIPDGICECEGQVACDILLAAGVPWSTIMDFVFEITVSSTGGQKLDNVVVTDHFGAQLDLDCDQGLFGDDSTFAGSHTIGSGGGPRLKWDAFGLALSGPFSSATIVCTGTTGTAGGGQQQYTKCATKDLNSGPNAMATQNPSLEEKRN